MHWNKITLVGVGLLGGSLGLAVKQRRLAGTVAGFVRRPASVKECPALGAVDWATCDLAEAVAGADLVVVCTPIAQMRGLVEAMSPALRRDAVVTDVGSVKTSVVRELEPMVRAAGAHFVGSHPMAGAERMGVSAARGDLFADAVCVITPTRRSNRSAVGQVTELWQEVGSRLLRLTPEQHDRLVSRSSHLPHVAAAVLANLVLDPRRSPHQALVCANGFRDTTRIASGSPEMWRDIALANRANLLDAIAAYRNGLEQFHRVLEQGDAAEVANFFQLAKQRRDQWSRTSGASSPE